MCADRLLRFSKYVLNLFNLLLHFKKFINIKVTTISNQTNQPKNTQVLPVRTKVALKYIIC